MPPKKQTVKMDLGSFLADDKFGDSWADDDFDVNALPIDSPANAGLTGISTAGLSAPGGDSDYKREEYPIPDAPPYTARYTNLPLSDVSQDEVADFFISGLQMNDEKTAEEQILDIYLPTDRATGNFKGFGFITFKDRVFLEDALKISGTKEMGGRNIFISVAAPKRGAGDRFGSSSGPRREEPNLDWGSARGTHQAQAPVPERRQFSRDENRGDRPRREEPNLDWGSARGSHQAQAPTPERRTFSRDNSNRSDRPRRQEPELNWGVARNTQEQQQLQQQQQDFSEKRSFSRGTYVPRTERPPRKQEPELDWGVARNTHATVNVEKRSSFSRENSKRGEFSTSRRSSSSTKLHAAKEPELDWGHFRGSALKKQSPNTTPKSRKVSTSAKKADEKKDGKPVDGLKKSSFHVLADDDDNEEEEEKANEKESKVNDIVKGTQELSIDENDGWNIAGKK